MNYKMKLKFFPALSKLEKDIRETSFPDYPLLLISLYKAVPRVVCSN